MTENRILLGRIGRAQGLRGEVRLTSFTQNPLAVASYGPLESADGKRQFVLEHVSLRKDVIVARIAGVSDRTAAEALVHQELWIERDKLNIAADEDEFLHADLIGCDVVTMDGDVLGKVFDLPNYGAGDLVEITLEGSAKTALLPFTKACVPHIDIAARHVTVVLPQDWLDDTKPDPDEDVSKD